MQVSKSYEGSIETAGSPSARQVSFGATGTVSNYQNRVDFVNQTIADFLHDECGVNAVYEAREGSEYKFLWVYDVPFLFSPTSSSYYYFGFYGPFYGTSLNPGSSSTANGSTGVLNGSVGYSLFFANTASAVAYKFTLYFDGDPENGFVLRVQCQSASISNGFLFAFAKATNLINGKDAVAWKYGAGINWWNGIDLDKDGTMDPGSFSSDYVPITPYARTKAVDHTNNPGKIPLIPITAGLWKLKNMYQRPFGFDLPEAVITTTPNQVAVDIAGRRFVVTNVDNTGTTAYLSCGLIEAVD